MKAVTNFQDIFEKLDRFALNNRELNKIKGGDGDDDAVIPPKPGDK